MARTATSRARQLSRPPEMPSTAVLACACSSRFARPSAWISRISSQRSARAAASLGTNGVGETGRVSAVSCSGMENGTVVWPAAFGQNVVLRRRSHCMRPRSSTASARPVPKGFASASSAPFSQMRSCAAKTISVVDSPCPASA